MVSRDFLLEIGVEEIPARFLYGRENEFSSLAHKIAEEHYFDHGGIRVLLTPRRIAVVFKNLAEKQKSEAIEKKGPSKSIAYDKDNNLTKAGTAFAKSCGAHPESLTIKKTEKGEYVFAAVSAGGADIRGIIPKVCERFITGLEFAKKMKWAALDFEFPRPIRWLVGLYGSEVIPFTICEVNSGNISHGVRYCGARQITITDAAEYELIMEDNGIIADAVRRRARLLELAQGICAERNLSIRPEPALLDEISFLVENPLPVVGEIREEFLSLPEEVLTCAMKHHQRFLPLYQGNGKISKYFLTFSNVVPDSEGFIKAGNERVLKARLDDAKFFYRDDRQKPLAEFSDSLKNMVFMADRGTMAEKSERIGRLGLELERMLAAGCADTVSRIAALCKNDLMTRMVFEFPELQGVMGAIYARESGEPPEIADAITEHYLPRQSDDPLPASLPGKIISIADKLDSVICAFSSGSIPTGSGDPLGIRRAMIGIIRILDEGNLRLNVKPMVAAAVAVINRNFSFDQKVVTEQVWQFFLERLRFYWAERLGLPPDVVAAGIELEFDYLSDLHRRIDAIRQFRDSGDITGLAVSFKRVINIQKGIDGITGSFDETLIEHASERELLATADRLKASADRMIPARKYDELLAEIAGCKPVVDRFFDDVLVMTEDRARRLNRLNLLSRLSAVFLRIIDFSRIQTE